MTPAFHTVKPYAAPAFLAPLVSTAPPLAVSPESVATLRALLTAHGERHGIAMILDDRSDPAAFACDFDARACLLSIAEVAACFGNDTRVIALVEEAQFQNRCLRVWQRRGSGNGGGEDGGKIMLDLSPNPDSEPKPEEAKLVREIETMEARVRVTERLFDRSEASLGMIDWAAMTRADYDTAASHREELGWTLYELDHGIEEASRELWGYCA